MATKAELEQAYEESLGYVPDRIRNWTGAITDADVDRVRASAPTSSPSPSTGSTGGTGGSAGTSSTAAEIIELFESVGLSPYVHFDGTFEENRPERIAQEINSGQRSLSSLSQLLSAEASRIGAQPSPSEPQSPSIEDLLDLLLEFEEPEPIDFDRAARNLFPFFPELLVTLFADAWEEFNDPELALAEVRQSPLYDELFPGIKRDDGSLRMSEQEWFSTREAYGRIFREFGLNPDIFTDRFTEMMENDVSPSEQESRLGAALEQVINNIPQVREAFARHGNLQLTDQAIFASVIDPDVGDAIINRRISVAQVAGEGLARGFDVDQDFAGRLASGGVDQMAARSFFATAEGRLSNLDELVRRHNDPDDDFDLEEFAEASIFGDPEQNRRIQRALRAEASTFSRQAGAVSTTQDLQVRGLSAR